MTYYNYLVAEKQGMSSTQALKNLFSSLADSSEEDRGGMKREEEGGGGMRTEKEERGGRRKIEDEGESTWREEEEERGQMMNEEEGGGTRIDNEEGGCERISQDEGGDIMRKEDDRCKEYCNAQFAQLKDEIKRELQEAPCSVQTEILINEKIKILSNVLEDTLSKLSGEINDVMIQICKSLNQIQDGTNNIEKRVGQLEKDLGEDQAAGIELNSLDPEKMQVGQPVIKIESEDPCAEIIQPSPGDDTRCSSFLSDFFVFKRFCRLKIVDISCNHMFF